jgi:hypothetical protein
MPYDGGCIRYAVRVIYVMLLYELLYIIGIMEW